MDIETLTEGDFWGKLHPREAPTAWHPLVDHCIDVASVARALLGLPLWVDRLTASGLPVQGPESLDAVAVLVGLHDLGKFSPGFQRARRGIRPVGHVQAGLQVLEGLQAPGVQRSLDRWLTPAAQTWLVATVSHQGSAYDAGQESLWDDGPASRAGYEVHRLLEALHRGFPKAAHGLMELRQAPPTAGRVVFPAEHGLCALTATSSQLINTVDSFAFRSDRAQDRVVFARAAAKKALTSSR